MSPRSIKELVFRVGAVAGVVGIIRISSPKPDLVFIRVSGGDLDEIADTVRDYGDSYFGVRYVIQHTDVVGHSEEYFI